MTEMRFWQLILLGALLAPFLVAGSTVACTCGGPASAQTMRDVAEWYSSNTNQIIFEGVVETQELKAGHIWALPNGGSTSLFGGHRVVSVRVLHSYRGEVSGTVNVLTGEGDADCGLDFETGRHYLVYAETIDPENLFTSFCAGTALVEQAGTALRVLRGEQPTADDLLDRQSYYQKFGPQWTGAVCGRVTKPDGTPVVQASVDLRQVRDEPFPTDGASDSDVTKQDGSFCIRYVRPGKYQLTAEKLESKKHIRWSGQYAAEGNGSKPSPMEVHAGDKLSDVHFSVGEQRVHSVQVRIVSADRSALPLERLGVSIDAVDGNALAYHVKQNRNENGRYPAGYVPAGHYVLQTYIRGDLGSGNIPAELLKWRMARQAVYIGCDSEIILKVERSY
jgi:carboxypeptidase family protein